jgi:hypothetical protein
MWLAGSGVGQARSSSTAPITTPPIKPTGVLLPLAVTGITKRKVNLVLPKGGDLSQIGNPDRCAGWNAAREAARALFCSPDWAGLTQVHEGVPRLRRARQHNLSALDANDRNLRSPER